MGNAACLGMHNDSQQTTRNMTTSKKLAAILAAVSLASVFAGGAFAADKACETAFRTKIQPILNTKCVACHQDAVRSEGLSLQRTSAPASLLGVPSQGSNLPLVAPGKPQQSYLYLKVIGAHLQVGGKGAQMPLGGALSEDDIKSIAAWITSCKKAN